MEFAQTSATCGFDFDHIAAVDMSFCTSLRNFIQIGPPYRQKQEAQLSLTNRAMLFCKVVEVLQDVLSD